MTYYGVRRWAWWEVFVVSFSGLGKEELESQKEEKEEGN